MSSRVLSGEDALLNEVLCNPVSLFEAQKVGQCDASDIEILDSSLNIIDEILSDANRTEQRSERDEPAPTPQPSFIVKFFTNHINQAIAVFTYVALIVAGVGIKIYIEQGCGGTDEPQCVYHEILGLPAWKWALFLGLRGPISWISHVLVSFISGIVSTMFLMSGNVVVFLLALKPQMSAFFVEIGWLVLWLLFTRRDYEASKDDNSIFSDVYVAVWKLIVLFAIWRLMAIFRHAFRRWLSLKFYHRAHYTEMMEALVHEHILMLLTAPGVLAAKHPKVTGWSCAHFGAIRFISHVLHGNRFQGQLNAEELEQLTTRLQSMRGKLLKAVTKAINTKREAGLTDEADAMATMLDAAIADACVRDLNMVRIAMTRQAGLKWRAKAAHLPAPEATPLLTRDMEEAAFKSLVDKQQRDKGSNGRTITSWASLGSLGNADADMLKNATRLSWIEEQVRHKTLHVTYLDDGATSSKRSLRRFRDGESQIDTDAEARKLGYFLFWHLKSDVNTLEITATDLDKVIPTSSSQSKTAWRMLDRDGNGAVSLSEVVERVIEIYKKRKNLAATLLDTETVVQQCFTAIRVVSDILWGFIFIGIYAPDKMAGLWAAMSATLLSFSFVFGNSLKQLWENAIYLFTMHPYNVGDLIRIGTVGASLNNADTYIVQKITLNHLQLERLGNCNYVIPMEQLRTLAVYNVTRSGEKWDSFCVYVDMDTHLEMFTPVAAAVKEYIAAHPKLFGGLYRCFYTNATTSHKLEVTIAFNYCQNGTDLFAVAIAKTGLFNTIAKAMTAVGIEFTIPPTKGQTRDAAADMSSLPMRVDFATTGGVPPATGASVDGMGNVSDAVMLAAAGVAALSAV